MRERGGWRRVGLTRDGALELFSAHAALDPRHAVQLLAADGRRTRLWKSRGLVRPGGWPPWDDGRLEGAAASMASSPHSAHRVPRRSPHCPHIQGRTHGMGPLASMWPEPATGEGPGQPGAAPCFSNVSQGNLAAVRSAAERALELLGQHRLLHRDHAGLALALAHACGALRPRGAQMAVGQVAKHSPGGKYTQSANMRQAAPPRHPGEARRKAAPARCQVSGMSRAEHRAGGGGAGPRPVTRPPCPSACPRRRCRRAGLGRRARGRARRGQGRSGRLQAWLACATARRGPSGMSTTRSRGGWWRGATASARRRGLRWARSRAARAWPWRRGARPQQAPSTRSGGGRSSTPAWPPRHTT
mmetsp:Transcript_4800/g.20558  ORF Transcript_4800/g.20558 Transcript_4800/m.20558 type:complete len:359 (-) Transcript_4800:935-2011(-)